MSNDVAAALQTASEIADLAAVAPGPVGLIAKITSLALKVGAGIAAAGGDPVIEITRMLSPTKEVAGVHSNWDDFIGRNFPSASEPPPAPDSMERGDTDPSPPSPPAMVVTDDDDDPYEEND